MAVVETGEFAHRFDLHDRNASAMHFAGHVTNAHALTESLGLPPTARWLEVLQIAAALRPGDYFARIDGVFVLAWQQAGTLHLFRDPSGLRDLYWCRSDAGHVHVASRMSLLLASPGLPPPRLARRGLHEYLRLLEIAAPNTIYDGITAVEPGQRITITSDTVQAPEPELARPALDAPVGLDAAVDRLELLLQTAIDERLDSARQPAAFLSGGVDSSLLCALAARRQPRLQTLTVGFDGTAFDETPAAARIAGQLGLPHTVLRFSRRQEVDALRRYVNHVDQPLADPACVHTLLTFEYVRQHYDAVLDGTGADEAVGGSPPRHVRWGVAWGARLPKTLRRQAVAGLRAMRMGGWTPLLDFEHPAETMMRWHGFARPEIEALCGEPVSFAHTRFFRSFARHDRHAHDARWSDVLDAMTCERLNQAAAISGAPLRYPFAALSVSSYLRGLPAALRHRPGEPKRILRELLRRRLPGAPHNSPKHGFDMPLQAFVQGNGYQLVRDHLLDGTGPLHGLLDRAAVAKLAQRFMEGESNLAFRVWALVILSGWLASNTAAR